jgi:hypothetical protein
VKADKIFELVLELKRAMKKEGNGTVTVKLASGEALEISYCLKKKPALKLISTPHQTSRSVDSVPSSRAK